MIFRNCLYPVRVVLSSSLAPDSAGSGTFGSGRFLRTAARMMSRGFMLFLPILEIPLAKCLIRRSWYFAMLAPSIFGAEGNALGAANGENLAHGIQRESACPGICTDESDW